MVTALFNTVHGTSGLGALKLSTSLVLTRYSDLDFVIVTQSGKLGNILTSTEGENEIRQVLGCKNVVFDVYFQAIQSILAENRNIQSSRKLVLALSLARCSEEDSQLLRDVCFQIGLLAQTQKPE